MTAALIYSRMDSQRLPQKALKLLGTKKLIQWAIDGAIVLEGVEPILLTTDRSVDDPLVEIALTNGIRFFRGDTHNVAKRTFDCINYYNIDIFARLNGDSPFLSKKLLREGIRILESSEQYDFVTNLFPRHFPYGMSVEVMRSDLFKKHYPEINTLSFQEHITSWFYNNTDQFRLYKIIDPSINDHDIRLVVDTAEDLEKLNVMVSQNPGVDFHTLPLRDLINLYKQTEIKEK
ncbi:MAG: hypothetical protein KDC85_11930 [Saprospiraceae bacterium]|nr:hypothetical protein [Saprospiraceae bacterium]MCB9326211.1 hypothetical protein [Lewinellaceae bacterium]